MGTRTSGIGGTRLRRPIVLALILAAVAVAAPHRGSAEQTRDEIVLRGDPAQTVTFRPAYGDLPATAPTSPDTP